MIRLKLYLIYILFGIPITYGIIWFIIGISIIIHAATQFVHNYIAHPIWQFMVLDFSSHPVWVISIILVYFLSVLALRRSELRRVGKYEMRKTTLVIIRKVFSTAFRWISVFLEFTAEKGRDIFSKVFILEENGKVIIDFPRLSNNVKGISGSRDEDQSLF